MKTALTWFGLIAFAAIGWMLGNPPWLGTIALIVTAFAVVVAVTGLEEKVADLRFDNDRLKEDLDRRDTWITDLERRLEDLESKERAR